MFRRIRTVAAPMVAVVQCGAATAQTAYVETVVPFVLRPMRIGMSPVLPDGVPARSLVPVRAPVQAGGGDHEWTLLLKRQTRRFGSTAQADDLRPRSRSRFLTVGDRFALAEQVTLDLGWRGVAISNANANVTIGGGRDRVKARDWFMPFATIRYRPTTALTMSMAHHASLRAFGETGFSGPMGMTRADFDAVRLRLRPEKSVQTRLEAVWSDADGAIAVSGYRMAVRDRLTFADGARLPVNAGGATLDGFGAAARRQLAGGLAGSVRYDQAAVRSITGRHAREREMAVEALWAEGGWRGTAAVAHADRWRVEAGLSYTATGPGGRPFRIAARISDPGRRTAMRLARDNGPTALRAIEQARAMMVTAGMGW